MQNVFFAKLIIVLTVYPKKYAHGFCFAVLCCGYTLTDFPISIRLTSLALWQSNDCPSASKATLINMDKYFMWIHYERLHNHNEAKHNKTVCIFLGIYCTCTKIVIKSAFTHRCIVTPYGEMQLVQPLLSELLIVWRHQAITWSNIVLSSVGCLDSGTLSCMLMGTFLINKANIVSLISQGRLLLMWNQYSYWKPQFGVIYYWRCNRQRRFSVRVWYSVLIQLVAAKKEMII